MTGVTEGAKHNSECLTNIDWSFTTRAAAPAIEGIHPYPAKFIGDIPRALIDRLQIPPGSKVLDPFCGSGTTLVEAQRAGLSAVGIDLNPIACLLSRVKTAPLPPGFETALRNVIQRAQAIESAPLPNIPNLNHWFKNDIQYAVAALAQTIAQDEYSDFSDQLRLSLSSILVKVSNQDSDTRYAAVDKNIVRDDVFTYFASAAQKLERALKNRDWLLAKTDVIEGDTLEVRPEKIGNDIGLVITSPPYPNAYEYWLYHKYRMWWLGFDPLAVKSKEIGARAHFFKKNFHTAELFLEQMRATFGLLSDVVVSGGYICFVIGRSKIHGKIVNNGDIVEKAALERSLRPISRFDRVINSNRKSFNLSHANIKTETILVFQKN